MSFVMTGNIKVEGFKAFKFHSAKWNLHIDNYADSAKFTIPAICYLATNGVVDYNKGAVPTGLQFKEGAAVNIQCGYDGKNDTVFTGFIKRVNYKVPLEVECEGYSYLLRKIMFTKSYGQTTVKQVLKDLIALVPGRPITLSPQTQDVPFEAFPFQNYPGTKVLEFLKEKYWLTVFFQGSLLYAGLRETLWNAATENTVKHRLNWNVIKDDALLFSADKEFSTVNIQMVSFNPNGTRNKALNKLLTPGNVKKLRTLLKHSTWLQKVADEQKKINDSKGYTGKMKTFLKPFVRPGMATSITDTTYLERTGRYFIEGVEGEFSPSGGRQDVFIANSL